MKVRKEKTHIGLIIQHTRTVELALRPSLCGSASSYTMSYALSQRPGGYVLCTINNIITLYTYAFLRSPRWILLRQKTKVYYATSRRRYYVEMV